MSEEYTREWWKERLPLIQAFVDNKKLLFDDEPTDERVTFAYQLYRYRIAPEPKLRPWKPDEVPTDCWIRTKSIGNGRWRILVIQSNGIVTAHGSADRTNPLQLASYEFALEALEHSTDGGVTWKPCGVIESQV